MTNAVATIPDQLPAYLAGNDTSNDEALSGLSLGGFPHIKLNSTRFQAVEGDNEYTINALELPVVILRAAPGVRKAWYATKYNPNSSDPGRGPDCFSQDSIKPHGASTTPQAANCASCPHNAFGSGTDQDGKPTKGKACSDNKQLAIFTQAAAQAGAENTIFGMKLPPASLKNFAVYVKSLSSKRVPLSASLTIVGFDPQSSYPVLVFRFGGLLNEQQYAKIQELAHGEEAEAIIASLPDAGLPVASGASATPVQDTAPQAAPAPQDVAADLGLGDPAPQTASQEAAPVAKAPEVDLSFDLGLGPVGGATEAPAQTQQPAAELVSQQAQDIDLPGDDDLAKQLGLV